MMIGQIQDIVSAAVVIGATEASGSTPGAAQSAQAASQAGSQQGQQDSLSAQDTPAASVDILQQVKDAAEQTDKTQKQQDQQDDDDEKKLDEASVSYITEELNKLMSRINCNLEFQYHKEVNTMSVKMLDKKTGDVLKEVPPEALIKHMIKAKDWLGAFLDKTI
ncbi:flagellar protein FlaG [uncultured Selenomonas sp.]|uniref:flagellar protein FlaG n=1 Tax=uncultured Selenomonas sp. TaxID=159275 RepID=UPI0025CDF840|nr:flagellar protein FlaG [uncultured Selenomonas sp.]